MEKEKQIIEIKYNKDMLEEDVEMQKNGNEEYLIQDTFNEDSMNELLEEGVVENEYKND